MNNNLLIGAVFENHFLHWRRDCGEKK